MNNKINDFLALFGVSLVISLFILMQSPLHPLSQACPRTDSSVFLYIGQAMQNGQIPYIDIFDHKGPFLYFLNFLGLSLGGLTAVWVMELLFIFISVVFCIKLARKFSSPIVSILSTCMVFVLFSMYFEGGNLVEEYSLPLIFIALYIFTGYFLNNYELSKLQTLITGICFGLVFLLRSNMIGLWVTFCPFIFIHTLFFRKFLLLYRYTIFFVLGTLIAVAPFLLFIILNGAFEEFINQYFLFNSRYSFYGNSGLLTRLGAFRKFSNNPLFGLSISFFLIIFLKRKNLSYNSLSYFIASFLFLIVSFCSILISGIAFPHYAMVLIPCYIVPISFVIGYAYKKMLEINKNEFIVFSSIICMSIYLLINPLLFSARSIKSTFWQDKEFNTLVEVIKENSMPNDLITSYGSMTSIYLFSYRKSVSKYIYQYPPANVSFEIVQEYKKDIQDKLPKIIFCSKAVISQPFTGTGNEAILNEFLNEIIKQKYNLLHKSENYLLYIRNDG